MSQPAFQFPKMQRKDGRIFVGQLPGELGRVPDPSLPFDFNLTSKHVRLRDEAVAKTLTNLAAVKSFGLLKPGSQTLSYTGALYQDIRGTRQYQRAHRHPFNPLVGLYSLPDFSPAAAPQFRFMLIEPLAVTDPSNFVLNYGDRLFEIAVSPRLIQVYGRLFQRQRENRPVEKNLIHDTLMLEALPIVHNAYLEAADRYDDAFRAKGWETLSLEEAGKRLSGLIHNGPQSQLVADQIETLDYSIVKAGPTHYGDLPRILLTGCHEIAEHSPPPPLARADGIAEYSARLETAAKGGSGDTATTDSAHE